MKNKSGLMMKKTVAARMLAATVSFYVKGMAYLLIFTMRRKLLKSL